MRATRLAAILLIYLGVAVAWAILGGSVAYRTETSFDRLHSQVGGLWGEPLQQRAPELTVEETVPFVDEKGKKQAKQVGHSLVPDSSDIKVKLRSDARRKGLLWYRTYAVEFDAVYTVKHAYAAAPSSQPPTLQARFAFPSRQAIYDDFLFSVNAQPAQPGGITDRGLAISVPLPPAETATIKVHYKSRGLDNWTYLFDEGVAQVRNFKMVVDTDFRRFDFTEKSLSPTHKAMTGNGWALTWQFANLISGFSAGVEMPEEPNPGPMISRISFFAPVGLLFFLAVVVIIGIMRGQNLHPMHYFFVAGGFFAFHLLMAYLGDHLEIRLTFLICAVVSVILVVSYLIRAIGPAFAIKVAAPAQLIYLVLFSYAFFFQGYTGLSITVASILTLAILMHITAKVDWESKFKGASQAGG
jgi:hypothetical protein